MIERDEAVRAGAIASRDGYARLLKAARAKLFDTLLVEEVSRFSRDFLVGMGELAQLAKLKVRLADTRSGVTALWTVYQPDERRAQRESITRSGSPTPLRVTVNKRL
ncbi:MAG: Resolvase, terminal domain [Pseudomonadota bacterium]